MNTIILFLTEISITLLFSLLLTGYLRPHLRRVLQDLCGTVERAQFWTVFANIILIGLPFLMALGFRPESISLETSFFEVIRRLSGNLAGYLFALVMVGMQIAFFAMVAPRAKKIESK
jgi:hypothetical protein